MNRLKISIVGKKEKMKRNSKDIKKGKKSMIRELLETVISAGGF